MYQKYVAVGRTTADLKLTFTKKGVAVANFTLAINRTNGKTDFIPCVMWDDKAKKYTDIIGKGSLLLIEGEWRTPSHEKDNGDIEYFYQVEIDKCVIQDKRNVASKDESEKTKE